MDNIIYLFNIILLPIWKDFTIEVIIFGVRDRDYKSGDVQMQSLLMATDAKIKLLLEAKRF